MIDKRKNGQTTPIRTYCNRSRPLPYSNPNYLGRPDTGSLPSTLALTRPTPCGKVMILAGDQWQPCINGGHIHFSRAVKYLMHNNLYL